MNFFYFISIFLLYILVNTLIKYFLLNNFFIEVKLPKIIKNGPPKYDLVNLKSTFSNTYVIIKREIGYYTEKEFLNFNAKDLILNVNTTIGSLIYSILFMIVPFLSIRLINYGYRETGRYDFNRMTESYVRSLIGESTLEEYFEGVKDLREQREQQLRLSYEDAISEYSRYLADGLYVNIRDLENKDDNEHLNGRNSINAFE
jgi:hypothetical protein